MRLYILNLVAFAGWVSKLKALNLNGAFSHKFSMSSSGKTND